MPIRFPDMSSWSRLFHLFFLISRPKTLGARCVILNDNEEVLLVKHTYIAGWHFPGGGVDNGETVAAALNREVEQEVSIVFPEPPLLFNIYQNQERSSWDHIVLYIAHRYRFLEQPTQTLEIECARFFSLSALPVDIERGTYDRIQEIISHHHVSPHW